MIVSSRLVHLSRRNLRLDDVDLLIFQLLDYLVTGLSVPRPNETEKLDLSRPDLVLLVDGAGNLALVRLITKHSVADRAPRGLRDLVVDGVYALISRLLNLLRNN